jgi:hypothetical protein
MFNAWWRRGDGGQCDRHCHPAFNLAIAEGRRRRICGLPARPLMRTIVRSVAYGLGSLQQAENRAAAAGWDAWRLFDFIEDFFEVCTGSDGRGTVCEGPASALERRLRACFGEAPSARQQRLMRDLRALRLCLSCHGPSMAPSVHSAGILCGARRQQEGGRVAVGYARILGAYSSLSDFCARVGPGAVHVRLTRHLLEETALACAADEEEEEQSGEKKEDEEKDQEGEDGGDERPTAEEAVRWLHVAAPAAAVWRMLAAAMARPGQRRAAVLATQLAAVPLTGARSAECLLVATPEALLLLRGEALLSDAQARMEAERSPSARCGLFALQGGAGAPDARPLAHWAPMYPRLIKTWFAAAPPAPADPEPEAEAEPEPEIKHVASDPSAGAGQEQARETEQAAEEDSAECADNGEDEEDGVPHLHRSLRSTVLAVLNSWLFPGRNRMRVSPVLHEDDDLFAFYDHLFGLLQAAWPAPRDVQQALLACLPAPDSVAEGEDEGAGESETAPQAEKAPPDGAQGAHAERAVQGFDLFVPADAESNAEEAGGVGEQSLTEPSSTCSAAHGRGPMAATSGSSSNTESETEPVRGSLCISRHESPLVDTEVSVREMHPDASRQANLLNVLQSLLYVRQPHEVRIDVVDWLHRFLVAGPDRVRAGDAPGRDEARACRIVSRMPGLTRSIRRLHEALVVQLGARCGWFPCTLNVARQCGAGPFPQQAQPEQRARLYEERQREADRAEYERDCVFGGYSGSYAEWRRLLERRRRRRRRGGASCAPEEDDADARLFVRLALLACAPDMTQAEARFLLQGLRLRPQQGRARQGGAPPQEAPEGGAATARLWSKVGSADDWRSWQDLFDVATDEEDEFGETGYDPAADWREPARRPVLEAKRALAAETLAALEQDEDPELRSDAECNLTTLFAPDGRYLSSLLAHAPPGSEGRGSAAAVAEGAADGPLVASEMLDERLADAEYMGHMLGMIEYAFHYKMPTGKHKRTAAAEYLRWHRPPDPAHLVGVSARPLAVAQAQSGDPLLHLRQLAGLPSGAGISAAAAALVPPAQLRQAHAVVDDEHFLRVSLDPAGLQNMQQRGLSVAKQTRLLAEETAAEYVAPMLLSRAQCRRHNAEAKSGRREVERAISAAAETGADAPLMCACMPLGAHLDREPSAEAARQRSTLAHFDPALQLPSDASPRPAKRVRPLSEGAETDRGAYKKPHKRLRRPQHPLGGDWDS